MTHQVFNKDDITDSYNLNELLGAHNNGIPVCDFIPIITLNDPVLQKWKDWFTQKRISWAVTLHKKNGNCTLWKKDERFTPLEIGAERKKLGVRWFIEE